MSKISALVGSVDGRSLPGGKNNEIHIVHFLLLSAKFFLPRRAVGNETYLQSYVRCGLGTSNLLESAETRVLDLSGALTAENRS